MNTKFDIATAKFLEGYNCAQAVVYSFSDDLQINKNAALKMACGFGAGMGRKGEVCGAVTGGIIAIGCKFGRGEEDDVTVTEFTYTKTQELMDEFAKKHGTFSCRELLDGCDLTTEEGRKHFNQSNLRNLTCLPCVQSVIKILEKIM